MLHVAVGFLWVYMILWPENGVGYYNSFRLSDSGGKKVLLKTPFWQLQHKCETRALCWALSSRRTWRCLLSRVSYGSIWAVCRKECSSLLEQQSTSDFSVFKEGSLWWAVPRYSFKVFSFNRKLIGLFWKRPFLGMNSTSPQCGCSKRQMIGMNCELSYYLTGQSFITFDGIFK